MLGGTPKLAAQALFYKNVQNFYKLPEVLSKRDSLMVVGAWYVRQQAARAAQSAPVACVWSADAVRFVRGRAV